MHSLLSGLGRRRSGTPMSFKLFGLVCLLVPMSAVCSADVWGHCRCSRQSINFCGGESCGSKAGHPCFLFFPTPEMKRIDGWGGQSTAGAISGVPVPAPPNHRKLLVQSDPTTTVHGCKLVASIHFGTFAYAKEAYLSKRSRFFSMVVLQLVHLIPYRDLSERADMLLMEKLSCTIWYLHVHSLAVLQLPARQGRAPGSRAVGLVCCGMQRSEGLKIRTIKISLFMDLRM